MQEVKKKKKHTLRHGRWLLLGTAVVVLTVFGTAYGLLSQPDAPAEIHTHEDLSGTLMEYDVAEVARLSVTLRSGEQWSAIQQEDGTLLLEDDPTFPIAESISQTLLQSVSTVSYSEILTDDPADYRDRLEEFGLDTPRAVAEITYADGVVCTLRIGDASELENSSFFYMTVDGDDRLFALDRGTAENLILQRGTLRDIEQPTLHKARFDRITFASGAEGTVFAQWELQGDIGNDAIDRWLLTVPVRYLTDADVMTNLQANLANIRLGAYVSEATSENLTLYGFDDPQLILTIHQAAGSMGSTDTDGVYSVTDWPEDTFTLVVGSAKNDLVDYVWYDDSIYTISHYSLEVFMNIDAVSTVSQYIVPVALGNLTKLTIQKEDTTTVYTITRTEQVAENNDLVTDSDGNIVYDITCDRDGVSVSYASFESAYNNLLIATVSGQLPSGWQPTDPIHTTLTLESSTGTTHTIALTAFDTLHDAVLIDGCALFYLIHNGLDFSVE